MNEEAAAQTFENLTPLEQQEMLRLADQISDAGYPEQQRKDDIIRFFRDILKEEDYEKIIKVGNLEKEEIGWAKLPVRNLFNIANYAEKEGLTEVSTFLKQKAGVISGSSLSKKAEFIRLLVTQKRETRTLGTPKRVETRGMFGKKTIVEEGMEE